MSIKKEIISAAAGVAIGVGVLWQSSEVQAQEERMETHQTQNNIRAVIYCAQLGQYWSHNSLLIQADVIAVMAHNSETNEIVPVLMGRAESRTTYGGRISSAVFEEARERLGGSFVINDPRVSFHARKVIADFVTPPNIAQAVANCLTNRL